MTSDDVVSRIRRLAGTRRVGHAGTLDPMATGVLVVGVERATRLLTYIVGVRKRYLATIRLGVSTVTDDAEGEPTGGADASGVSEPAVRAGIAALTGDIRQVPSAVSAVKVDGRRSYARVRSHGGPLSTVDIVGPYGVFDPSGRVVAIVSERDGRARPEVVLTAAG